MLINLHTHSPTLLPGLLELESVYFGQSKAPTSPTCSVGLHPWYLEEIDLDMATAWLREQAELSSTLAIGEAGLDKVCKTPWDLQVQAFQGCMEISERLGKPLIIHCVRAFSEIIALKKVWKPQQTWIFHGFDKHPSTAAMLLRAGCCLSFGAALLRENGRAVDSFRAVPADRFFLETDASQVSISAIYQLAAALLGLELEALEEQLEDNFKRYFNQKSEVINKFKSVLRI